MVNVTGYAFPWDFGGDSESATRAAALGVEVVALAASYHAARVVTPLHPTRRVRDIPYSAFYVPRDDEVWRGHRLIPRTPEWLGDEHAFERASRQLTNVGLVVDPWLVLTHVDGVGDEHPDLVVHNAFDERYSYALCPTAPDVLEYCRTLVTETLRLTNARGIVLEACGPVGFEHSGPHEKSEFAQLSISDLDLLSLCFCPSCQRGLGECGIDACDLAQRVRDGVGSNAASIDDALGVELADEVARFRVCIATALQEALVDAIKTEQPDARVTLHASAHRWATGSFPVFGVVDSLDDVTTVVANCWDPTSSDTSLRQLRARTSPTMNVGGFVRVDHLGSDDEIDDTLASYVESGMDELHLYHLGLLTRSSVVSTRRAVNAFRAIRGYQTVRVERER